LKYEINSMFGLVDPSRVHVQHFSRVMRHPHHIHLVEV